jgi:hypothetical protein
MTVEVRALRMMYLYEPQIYLCWCNPAGPLRANSPSQSLREPVDQPLHFPAPAHDRESNNCGGVPSVTGVEFVPPKCPIQDVDLILWKEANETLDAPNAFLRQRPQSIQQE